jgi:HJR/Mrr/RecB family endonuclease
MVLLVLLVALILIGLIIVAASVDRTESSQSSREKKENQQAHQRWLNDEQERKQRNEAADTLRREEAARLAQTLIPSLDELRKLTPQHFEDAVAQMFKRLGYAVQQTPHSNDRGRDGILTKNGEKLLYECKRYGENSVSGRPDLQRFASAITDDDAKSGFFITTGAFSQEAIEYAKGKPIELIGGRQLMQKMFESNEDTSQPYDYKSMCRQCGQIVSHKLRMPEEAKCLNGHIVRPSLTVGHLLVNGSNPPPLCVYCEIPMVRRDGPRGPFWGCQNYRGPPRFKSETSERTKTCTFTRKYEQAGEARRPRRRRRRRSRWR